MKRSLIKSKKVKQCSLTVCQIVGTRGKAKVTTVPCGKLVNLNLLIYPPCDLGVIQILKDYKTLLGYYLF